MWVGRAAQAAAGEPEADRLLAKCRVLLHYSQRGGGVQG
jgi:hypothetical protein